MLTCSMIRVSIGSKQHVYCLKLTESVAFYLNLVARMVIAIFLIVLLAARSLVACNALCFILVCKNVKAIDTQARFMVGREWTNNSG